MSHSNRNSEHGTSLTEVLVALALVSICLLGLLSMQPRSWQLVGRADCLNRAAGLLNDELEKTELMILNPENDVPGESQTERSVPCGERIFMIRTTITGEGDLFYAVTTRVTWPGDETGISGSRRITRQEMFRQL